MWDPHHEVFLCVLPSSTPCILPGARQFTLFFTGSTSQRFRVPVCKERTSLTQPLGYSLRSYSKASVRVPATFPSLMSRTPRRALRVVQSRWPLGILCPQITGAGRALTSARQKGIRDVPFIHIPSVLQGECDFPQSRTPIIPSSHL